MLNDTKLSQQMKLVGLSQVITSRYDNNVALQHRYWQLPTVKC